MSKFNDILGVKEKKTILKQINLGLEEGLVSYTQGQQFIYNTFLRTLKHFILKDVESCKASDLKLPIRYLQKLRDNGFILICDKTQSRVKKDTEITLPYTLAYKLVDVCDQDHDICRVFKHYYEETFMVMSHLTYGEVVDVINHDCYNVKDSYSYTISVLGVFCGNQSKLALVKDIFDGVFNDKTKHVNLVNTKCLSATKNKVEKFKASIENINTMTINEIMTVFTDVFGIDVRFDLNGEIYITYPDFFRNIPKFSDKFNHVLFKPWEDSNSIEVSPWEDVVNDDMVDIDVFKEPKKSKKLNPEEQINQIINESEGIFRLIKHDSISSHTMYYNCDIIETMGNINKIISKEKYDEIVSKLSKANICEGISCIFHGDAGTGKTESVLQLAKQSGRDIIKVDLSNINDKWVGESEKHTQKIFDDYSKILKICEEHKLVVPILFLNEADGFFVKRISNIDTGHETSINACVNIILDNMERFKGIMFATTNFINNLDKALDRRILYKVKFEMPDETVRKQIWKDKMSEISDEDIAKLAKEYNFSGAQIDNIAKKSIIDNIITGNTSCDYTTIVKHCNTETINKSKAVRKIGF